MTFKEQLDTDLAVFYNTDEFGVDVVYTTAAGVVSSIVILYEAGRESLQDPAPAGDEVEIRVKRSDVAAPSVQGDTLTIDAETWYVTRNLGGEPDTGEWRLRISRSARRQL